MSKTVLRFSALFGALLVVVAACSSGGTDEAIDATVDAGDGTEVTVSLTEWGIEMSRSDFEAGVEYTFVVRNDGKVAHEMMFLPPVEGKAPSMEVLDEMAVAVFEADDLGPGQTVTQTVVFPSLADGETLEAACHVSGHYAAGMKAPITVTG